MPIPGISIETARSLAIQAQKLGGQTPGTGLPGIFDQIGYVQIDTISVVNRAHLHTIWTRCPEFAEDDLYRFQEKERRIYEYWSHAMSYLRMEDFRYSLPRMQKFKDPNSGWFKSRYSQTRLIIPEILKRIREEGPLSSSGFENTSGNKGGAWWDWKPAKIALEVLYWQGELMISGRQKFQKLYDLTERVLPPSVDKSFPSQEEVASFIILGALKSFGVASEKEIGMFMQPGTSRDADMQLAGKKDIKNSLLSLMEEKKVIPVKIEGVSQPYYGLPEISGKEIPDNLNTTSVRFLSPFDNLIIQRERTRQLFNFDYSLECYTPEPKRQFGYFVFPVLFGNNLVARFDPKADRRTQTLTLKSLYFEPGFFGQKEFLPPFVAELIRFARFNNCKKIVAGKCSDPKFYGELNRKFKTVVV